MPLTSSLMTTVLLRPSRIDSNFTGEVIGWGFDVLEHAVQPGSPSTGAPSRGRTWR